MAFAWSLESPINQIWASDVVLFPFLFLPWRMDWRRREKLFSSDLRHGLLMKMATYTTSGRRRGCRLPWLAKHRVWVWQSWAGEGLAATQWHNIQLSSGLHYPRSGHPSPSSRPCRQQLPVAPPLFPTAIHLCCPRWTCAPLGCPHMCLCEVVSLHG